MSTSWYGPGFSDHQQSAVMRLEVCHGKKNPPQGQVFGFLVAGAGFGTLPVVFNLAA